MALAADQLTTLRHLIREVGASNRFYQPVLADAGIDADVESLGAFAEHMPLTTKAQLAADQAAAPPFGTNLTYPLEQYIRFHQTSGSTGQTLRWLDTQDSWQAMLACWQQVFIAAGCPSDSRVFFAFSFGPFLGFWTAFEAAAQLGYLAIPGGGMSSTARLRSLTETRANVLCCTPTYALHLAEVADQEQIDRTRLPIRHLILAGEPGGCVPATRARLEAAWPNARVCDHHGMTEVGPVTYEDYAAQQPGAPANLRIIADAFLAEVIDPQTTAILPPGATGELVLTTLRRVGAPLLRYRTGDLVRTDPKDPYLLRGGILGRVDDMVVVRGVNIFPAHLDHLVRQFPEVAEYRVDVDQSADLIELRVTLEPQPNVDAEQLATRVATAIRDDLSLRVPVRCVAPGALPRFEMKARRWHRTTSDD